MSAAIAKVINLINERADSFFQNISDDVYHANELDKSSFITEVKELMAKDIPALEAMASRKNISQAVDEALLTVRTRIELAPLLKPIYEKAGVPEIPLIVRTDSNNNTMQVIYNDELQPVLITMNPGLTTFLTNDEQVDIIRHELAHVVAKHPPGATPEQEHEADAIAIRLGAKPSSYAATLKKLDAYNEQCGQAYIDARLPRFLFGKGTLGNKMLNGIGGFISRKSHPLIEKRIATVQAMEESTSPCAEDLMPPSAVSDHFRNMLANEPKSKRIL